MGFSMIFFCYITLFSIIGGQSAMAFVRDFENKPHHVIFDDLGKMSTGVTYINVAIPLNISIMNHQIEMFDGYLATLQKFDSVSNINNTLRDNATLHNMEQLQKQLASYAKKRLAVLADTLSSLDDLLPIDPSFDKDNERHKRFIFMIPMIICEVNKKALNAANKNLTDQLDIVQHELDLYKAEYARLYEDTMPDLIPQYIEDHHDAMDQATLNSHVDFLTRTKRDVQFLMNIIKTNSTANNPTFRQPLLSTKSKISPNPFANFTHLFSKPKPRQANKTYFKPGTSEIDRMLALFKANSSAPSTTTTLSPLHPSSPGYIQPLNTISKPYSHEDLIDLNVPYALRNRTKRFLPAAILAAGALGTFLGIFNTYEINNIRNQMATMSNNQNLLIKVSKINTEQINQLATGLVQLRDTFTLYLKNNPALLYAKFDSVLESLTDKLEDLKDTIQMLQLQRLSTSTLSSTQIKNIYQEITAIAKANNLLTLTNKPQDLFQLDTSYVRVQNEILILIHVPCSSPSSLLTIYKYVPFPIPVRPRPKTNTTITKLQTIQDVFDISSDPSSSTKEGIHFTPDADLIAIGKNEQGRHRYILLSAAELSACTKRSQAYMCERHQVTKSDLLGSCLGSLYLQSPNGVISNCKINRIPLKETVYQISNTNHIVFTPFPITTQITCFNGSYFPLKIKNTQQIRIPEGCRVELTNHTITSDFSIRTTSDSVHFEWDFDPISLPDSAKLMIDSISMDSKLDFLQNKIDSVYKGTVEATGFENLMVEHIQSGSWLSTLFIVCFAVTGLLALSIGGICLRNYLLRRGWIGQRPPHHPVNVGFHLSNDNINDAEEMQELQSLNANRHISTSRTETIDTAISREPAPVMERPSTSYRR